MSVKVYHMTTKANWESIQMHGVIEKGLSIEDDIKPMGVFVVGDKEDALTWCSWASREHGNRGAEDDDLACLEINIPLDLVDNIKPDPCTNSMIPKNTSYIDSYAGDWYFADDIPLDWVNRVHWVKQYYRHRKNGQMITVTEFNSRVIRVLGSQKATVDNCFNRQSWEYTFKYRGIE